MSGGLCWLHPRRPDSRVTAACSQGSLEKGSGEKSRTPENHKYPKSLSTPPPQPLENKPFLFQSLFSSLPFCEPPADKSQPGLAGGRGGEPPTIGRMIRNPATFLVLANAPLQPFGRKEVTKENKINLRKFKRHSTKKARPSHCSVRRTESGGLPSSFPINLRL